MLRHAVFIALVIAALPSAAEVGIPDTLVVGVPWEDVDGVIDAGAVQAVFGPIEATGDIDDQLLHQYGSLPGTGELEDYFGSAIVGGDFNGDGRMDLAIGVPNEDHEAIANAGVVHVLYARIDGIFDAADSELWRDDDTFDVIEADDEFGASLAAGDFNGDTIDDLVVGIPGESTPTNDHVGRVAVIFGSSEGLTDIGLQWWHQEIPGVPDDDETGDRFGSTLAVGDFNGDHFLDLAIGSPQEDVAQFDDGAVTVLYGSALGLTAADASFLTDPFPSGEDSAEFGFALAAGDLDGDDDDELIVGAPHTNVIGFSQAGQITVYFGDHVGVSNLLFTSIVQGGDILGETVAGWPGETNLFGRALACGNFNGDAYDDLVVAAPWDDEAGPSLSGAVHVFYGSADGPSAADDQLWHGDTPDLPVVAGAMTWFGFAVGAGDLNGDDIDDLAVGIPLEDGPAFSNAGGVVTIPGGLMGLTSSGSRLLQQGVDGLSGIDETDDYFGAPIAVLRGVEDPLFADDFETGGTGSWSEVSP
ncbi:MAG: hypothetical protein V2I67_01830 [Thermoanaerobaculales bacterium]|nr:hypothetical protein [Thermoanaerobaculales bacterium]